jgi:integrase
MASIYKRKGTAGRYRVKFRDPGGAWRDVLGYTDAKGSEEMARKLERLASLRAAGETPPPELSTFVRGLPVKLQANLAKWGLLDGPAFASTRPVTNHLDDYKVALLSGVASRRQKGPSTAKHANLVYNRVKSLLEGIGARVLTDITNQKVGIYLSERRTKGLSTQSSNHYLRSCKAFLSWMVRTGRATQSPLTDTATIEVTHRQRKHVRRPLEHVEAARLLEKTKTGPIREGMPNVERYWLYRIALETALRSSELRALTREHFELDDNEPFVWLGDDDTKNRKETELPLRSETVVELRLYLAGKHPKTAVFPNMPAKHHISRMIRADLEAAGITYSTDSGVVDFHALRGTCLSWLADAGTPLKVLQDFARHSDPKLTMNVYARTLRGSLAGAAGRLPDLAGLSRAAAKATGTDNKTAQQTTPRTTPNGSQKRASACANPQSMSAARPPSTSAERPYEKRQKARPSHRRRRDSNPRDGCPPNGFQDRRLQPLGHSSR